MSENPYASPLDAEFAASQPPDPHDQAKLATRSQRLVGAVIDAVVNIGAAIPLFSLLILPEFGTLINSIRSPNWLLGTDLQSAIIGSLVGTTLFFVIHGFTLATRGQTIGKLIVGTRIVDQNTHELVPFGRLFVLRYLLMEGIRALPAVGRLISLVNVLLIFREDHKCLHDDFCGTVVVRAR